MEKRVLVIGCKKGGEDEAQNEWIKGGNNSGREGWGRDISIHLSHGIAEGVSMLKHDNNYVLVVFFPYGIDSVASVKSIRDLTSAPILVIKEKYDGMEKIAAIKAGADEYIQRPENPQESIASCYALIRRSSMLGWWNGPVTDVVSRAGVVISMGHRRIFIREQELELSRREFDLFCLLASSPEQVFTYEQLLRQVWDDEYVTTTNKFHSCVRKIRRKLESVSGCPCCIENMRGIGYRFRRIS